jgi:hypothetical protein
MKDYHKNLSGVINSAEIENNKLFLECTLMASLSHRQGSGIRLDKPSKALIYVPLSEFDKAVVNYKVVADLNDKPSNLEQLFRCLPDNETNNVIKQFLVQCVGDQDLDIIFTLYKLLGKYLSGEYSDIN